MAYGLRSCSPALVVCAVDQRLAGHVEQLHADHHVGPLGRVVAHQGWDTHEAIANAALTAHQLELAVRLGCLGHRITS
jgi:hypothetical protein